MPLIPSGVAYGRDTDCTWKVNPEALDILGNDPSRIEVPAAILRDARGKIISCRHEDVFGLSADAEKEVRYRNRKTIKCFVEMFSTFQTSALIFERDTSRQITSLNFKVRMIESRLNKKSWLKRLFGRMQMYNFYERDSIALAGPTNDDNEIMKAVR